MLLADYAEYVKAQERVEQLYKVNIESFYYEILFYEFRIQLNGQRNLY